MDEKLQQILTELPMIKEWFKTYAGKTNEYGLKLCDAFHDACIELGELEEHISAFEGLWFEQKQKNQRLIQALEKIVNETYTITKAEDIAEQAIKEFKSESNKVYCEFCTDDGCNVCRVYENAPHQYE